MSDLRSDRVTISGFGHCPLSIRVYLKKTGGTSTDMLKREVTPNTGKDILLFLCIFSTIFGRERVHLTKNLVVRNLRL